MNQNKNTKKKRKGFTLIELIIVLAIMAIIAGIAIPNFTAVRDNARVKADTQSCETIKRTVLMLVADGTIANATTDPKTATVSTFSPAVAVTNATAVAGTSEAFAGGEVTQLTDALKDIKAPQGSGTTGFKITVDKSGNVVVKVTP